MKIGDICEVVRGSSPRPRDDSRYYDGPVPRLMIADVTRDGKYVSAKIDSLTELGAKQSRPMSSGEVVIAVSGAPGLPAVLAHDACIHDGFVGLRKLDTTQVNIDFLYRYLIFVRLQSSGRAVGAIFKNLTTEQIRETIIPDFPIETQKRIAAILDQAEALRSLRRQSIGQLDALARSVFLEMFGDPVTNPKGWEIGQLQDIAEFQTGYPFSSSDYIEHGEGIKLCRGANVLPNHIDWKDLALWPKSRVKEVSEFNLQVGDVVVAMDRPWISSGFKIAQIQDVDLPALLVQRVARLRGTNGFLNSFIFELLKHPIFTRQCKPTETTIPHISPRDIKTFSFPIPPLALQQEFADRIGAIEALKAQHRESLAKMDTLFASLQHRAFRGEL
jgi:type I restriction enzyme, S subunit